MLLTKSSELLSLRASVASAVSNFSTASSLTARSFPKKRPLQRKSASFPIAPGGGIHSCTRGSSRRLYDNKWRLKRASVDLPHVPRLPTLSCRLSRQCSQTKDRIVCARYSSANPVSTDHHRRPPLKFRLSSDLLPLTASQACSLPWAELRTVQRELRVVGSLSRSGRRHPKERAGARRHTELMMQSKSL